MVNGMPLAKLLLNVQVTDGQTPDVWQQQTQVKLKKVGEGVRSGMKTANAFNISCQMPALDRDRSRNVGSGLQSPATANRGLWRENNSLLWEFSGCSEVTISSKTVKQIQLWHFVLSTAYVKLCHLVSCSNLQVKHLPLYENIQPPLCVSLPNINLRWCYICSTSEIGS